MFIDHGAQFIFEPVYGRQNIALLTELSKPCGFYKHCAATRLLLWRDDERSFGCAD
jgi:hypothetical protein